MENEAVNLEPKAQELKSRVLPYILLALLAMIWGSSFILMKKGLRSFDSHEVAALRILIAFFFLLPFGIVHFKQWHPEKWKYFLAVGMFGNFIPAFLFTLAETRISSSLAGLLNSLTPIFTLILGGLFFGMKVTSNQVWGIVLGFLGASLLIFGSGISDIEGQVTYGLLVVLATLCYGISVNVIRRFLSDISSVTTSFWAFMLVGPLALFYLFTTDVSRNLQTPEELSSLGYVGLLGIFGTAGAVILFNVLIRRTNAVFASSVTYLIPVVALGWGVLDGEQVSWVHAGAIVLILLGIFLINRKLKPKSADFPDNLVENPKKA